MSDCVEATFKKIVKICNQRMAGYDVSAQVDELNKEFASSADGSKQFKILREEWERLSRFIDGHITTIPLTPQSCHDWSTLDLKPNVAFRLDNIPGELCVENGRPFLAVRDLTTGGHYNVHLHGKDHILLLCK